MKFTHDIYGLLTTSKIQVVRIQGYPGFFSMAQYAIRELCYILFIVSLGIFIQYDIHPGRRSNLAVAKF